MPRNLSRYEMLAAVENSGELDGDFAQLTGTVLKDLQQNKGLFKGIKFEDILSNPKLYIDVVDAYWSRLDDFGIVNDTDKAIWWLMPGRYKQAKGNINNLSNPRFRNIMENRYNNLNAFSGRSQMSKALEESI